MLRLSLLITLSVFALAQSDSINTYDYVVVGSGPGGGPLAANLARHGHSVLLVEAGDDQSANLNSEIPQLFPFAFTDPTLRWDFFVRHYTDDARTRRNNQVVWRTSDGAFYVGTSPPPNSTLLGMYYPRGGTLGGSSAINAMGTVLPSESDWQNVVDITGDTSWNPKHMRDIFQRIERNHYLDVGTPGHGFDGYLDTNQGDPSGYEAVPNVITIMKRIAAGLGQDPDRIMEYLDADINFLSPDRDWTQGIFNSAVHVSAAWRRFSSRDYILATANATNLDGSKKYPLHIQLNTLATKVLFETEPNAKPCAKGIEFLSGKSVYSADPRHESQGNQGIPGTAYARKEVILSGGTFNTPQLLMLSGIGPAAELSRLNITTLVDHPGVGHNLQDNYEFPIVGHAAANLTAAPDPNAPACTFGAPGDPCVDLWRNGAGPYMGLGNLNGNFYRSNATPALGERDVFFTAGTFAIRGFLPPTNAPPALDPPNTFAMSTVKIHPRNRAGVVRLRSADPRDTPDITFNYFNGADINDPDLAAMADMARWAKGVFASVPEPVGPVEVVEPPQDGDGRQWIMDQAFSHHCTSTAAIGADNDPLAVLDSKFRVRSVSGLRVVDASAFPRTPGPFPVLPTFMLSEKATESIIDEVECGEGL